MLCCVVRFEAIEMMFHELKLDVELESTLVQYYCPKSTLHEKHQEMFIV